MTYFRLGIRGEIASGEVWSINPAFTIGNEVGPTKWDQALGQTAVTACAAIAPGTTLRGLLPAGGLTSLRLELRSNAHFLLGAAEAPYSGTAPTGSMSEPPQQSIVISLRTEVPGRSHRGRLYWPAVKGATTDTGGRVPAATVTGALADAKTYLRALQDAIKAGAFPGANPVTVELAVVSQTIASQTRVKTLQIGNVFDVQRRRRDALKEAYTAVSLY